MMCRNDDTEYVHVTLLYSSFASVQKHCNGKFSRDVHLTQSCHLTSFDVCLCHCTGEGQGRGGRGGGGGGGGEENDEKSIIKRL